MIKDKFINHHKKVFVDKSTFLERNPDFRNLLIFVVFVFSILTFYVKQYDYFKFDLTITLFIQRYQAIWFDILMKSITFLGNPGTVVILIAFFAGYGYMLGKNKTSLMLVTTTIGGLILSQIIKILVGRPRPDPTLIYQVGTFLKADSFPSGHVLGAASLYGFLLYIAYTQLKKNVFRRLVIVSCILMIILMGLSRIYVGAHWFSDVLGAYLLGFVWLSFMILIYQRLNPKVKPE